MPTYTVCLIVPAEKYIDVEADDEEQAIAKALESDENDFNLCHACNDELELGDTAAQEAKIVEVRA